MKRTTEIRRLLLTLFALAMCIAGVLLLSVGVAAEDDEPQTAIAGHNLAIVSNVQVGYYVTRTNVPAGAECGVLVFDQLPESFEYGNEKWKLTEDYRSGSYYIYYLEDLSLYQITDILYAVSYVKVGDDITYSALDKYSVLEYCHKYRNSNVTVDGNNATLGELVTSILEMGATAQKYSSYRTDFLATDDVALVKLTGATFADGFNRELAKIGAELTFSTVGGQTRCFRSGTWAGDGSTLTYRVKPGDVTLTALNITPSEGLSFANISGTDTCMVTGIGTCTDTEIWIPSSHNGKAVVSIRANAFDGQTGIESVVIPTGVTTIGNYAFRYCTALESVLIPDGMTSIGQYAFYGCSSLSDVTIPDSVTTVNDQAFCGCSSIQSVIIPDSVTYLGQSAFRGCSSLASVTLPANLTAVNQFAFYETALVSVTIPATVTTVGLRAFGNCPNLSTVLFAAGSQLLTIGESAFSTSESLSYVEIPYGVTTIEALAFRKTALTSVVLPDTVTTIGHTAFAGCSSLVAVDLGSGITSVGQQAFKNDTALETVYYRGYQRDWDLYVDVGADNGDLNEHLICLATPDVYVISQPTCTDDGQYLMYDGDGNEVYGTLPALGHAFLNRICTLCGAREYSEGLIFTATGETTCEVSGVSATCTTLDDLWIPPYAPDGRRVTAIGWGAFENNTNLIDVLLPSTVTEIQGAAFRGCVNLGGIGLSDNLTVIGSSAFSGCSSLYNIVCPDKLTTIGENAFMNCTGLTHFDIPNPNPTLYPLGFGLSSIGANAFSGCSNLTELILPDSLTVIANFAFDGFSGLENITVPASVTSIGNYAFRNCTALESVRFAEGSQATSIGNYAFLNCTSLYDIEFPTAVTSVGDGAFMSCESLEYIYPGINTYTIGDYAFCGCSMLDTVLLNSVHLTDIGDYAFEGCFALRWAVYRGTAADWADVTVGSNGNVWLLNALIFPGVTVITQPTCTQSGICEVFEMDGYPVRYPMPALGHTYANGVNGPCTRCGAIKYSEGLEFDDDDSLYCDVLGIGTCTDTEIWIPPTDANGRTVLGIAAGAFRNQTNVVSVVIPDTVVAIAGYAFSGSGLTSIVLPAGVSILPYAFKNCENLTSVVLESGISQIMANAFEGCSALTRAVYRGTADEWEDVYVGTANDCLLDVLVFPGMTAVVTYSTCTVSGAYDLFDENGIPTRHTLPAPGHTYANGINGPCTRCGEIKYSEGLDLRPQAEAGFCFVNGRGTCTDTEIWIPLTDANGRVVSEIGTDAFKNATDVVSVIIPDTVVTIGLGSFSGSGLTSIVLPESVLWIQSGAFKNCANLTSVAFGRRVNTVGTEAFTGCTSLSETLYYGTYTDFDKMYINLYNTQMVKTLTYYEPVGHIGIDHVCAICGETIYSEGLEFAHYGDGTCYLSGMGTCTDTDVWIPPYSPAGDRVDFITSYAFHSGDPDANLTFGTIVVPEGVTRIEYEAFGYISARTIVLPESLTRIGDAAFRYCNGLEKILYKGRFYQFSAINWDYDTNPEIINLVAFFVSNQEGYVGYAKGLEFTSLGNDTCALTGLGTFTGEYLFIPPTDGNRNIVVKIGSNLLGIPYYEEVQEYEYAHYTYMEIPNTVTTIDSLAFRYIYVQFFYMGRGLTSISASAFSYSQVVHIYFPEGATVVPTNFMIGDYMLHDTCLYLPTTLTLIEAGAFGPSEYSELPDEKLEYIFIYNGTLEDWNNITFEPGWIQGRYDIEIDFLEGTTRDIRLTSDD